MRKARLTDENLYRPLLSDVRKEPLSVSEFYDGLCRFLEENYRAAYTIETVGTPDRTMTVSAQGAARMLVLIFRAVFGTCATHILVRTEKHRLDVEFRFADAIDFCAADRRKLHELATLSGFDLVGVTARNCRSILLSTPTRREPTTSMRASDRTAFYELLTVAFGEG